MEGSGALLVHNFEIMTTYSFKMKCSVVAFEESAFLKWVFKIDVLTAKKFYRIIVKNNFIGTKPTEKSIFARSSSPIMKEIRTE